MGRRSQWHKNIVAKLAKSGLKLEVRIIASGLTNDSAVALERERIAFYGRAALVNQTDGGEGAPGGTPWNKGMKLPPVAHSVAQKIAETLRGRRRPPEVGSRISASKKGVPLPSLRGRSLSQETKDRISVAKKGIPRPQWVVAKVVATKAARKAARLESPPFVEHNL